MPCKCSNPEGIFKECGKDGKPVLWLSMLSIFWHFHGLYLEIQIARIEVAEIAVFREQLVSGECPSQ